MTKEELEKRVTELEDYRKVWNHGLCRCEFCSYLWVGVFHKNCVKLECPGCKKINKLCLVVEEKE